VKVTAGRRGGEEIHVDAGASQSIFYFQIIGIHIVYLFALYVFILASVSFDVCTHCDMIVMDLFVCFIKQIKGFSLQINERTWRDDVDQKPVTC